MREIDAAVAAAEARLDEADPVGAARCIERFESQRAEHERLAMVWARLLPSVGNHKVLERQMRALAAEWPRHPVVALTIAEAGTRWTDPWPLDGRTDRLAALAVDIVERCLADGLVPARWAARLHLARARALARLNPDAEDEALAAFEQGLRVDPRQATGWADLARLHQIHRRWDKGLAAAEHALELDPEHRPARWTAAVCATVLARPQADTHWRAIDHLPAGLDDDGRPRVDALPPVEVLLDPRVLDIPPLAEEAAAEPPVEVVWVHPTSPAHGRIASPTVLDLPVDFDDVIAWDPVPLGFRPVGETEVPRFAARAKLAAGRARTWRVRDPLPDDVELPRGWRLYRFSGRVSGVHGADGGKLITPRSVDESAVRAALAGTDLRLDPST